MNAASVPFGKYTLRERIAATPFTDVYRAVTRRADGGEIPVVFKQIRPETCKDPKFMAAFVEEARIASMLDHPNIARTYEWGRHEDVLFIAMEYIEGTTLASIMQSLAEQKQRFPPTIGLYLVLEVLKGLEYAHGLKDAYGNPLLLVHRGVSPPNIALSSVGEVKLIDFGLAKVASQIAGTLPGLFQGKITYMSPEQVWHRGVDNRSDLYSCGVILYELLSGSKLKADGEEPKVHQVIEAARARPPSKFFPDIPAELDALVLRSMSENPQERPVSAEQMRESLGAFLHKWDRKVDAEIVSSFLVDVLTGRLGQKKDRASFAFGEATSQWMAQGENLVDLRSTPSQVEVPVEAREHSEMSLPSVPRETFAGGGTVMAIQEGGLGKARQWKTLALVLGVAAVAVLLIILVVASLGKEQEGVTPKEAAKQVDDRVVAATFAGPMELKTKPVDVIILVDGDPVKAVDSPPRIIGLTTGLHRIRLAYPGYLTWEGDITLEADKPFVLTQELTERKGQVTIKSVPAKAKLYLNGKLVGRTPRTLTNLAGSKSHKLALLFPRFQPIKFAIEPTDWPEDPNEVLTVEKKLEKVGRKPPRKGRHR